jgi:pimeloyl-ACP methyl ester carboxylesterase
MSRFFPSFHASAGAASLALIAVACTSEDARVEGEKPPPTSAPPHAEKPDAAELPPATGSIAWTKCSLVPKKNDGDAECAVVDLPRDPTKPERGTLPIALKRIPSAVTPRRGALWLLHGGPGASGTAEMHLLAGLIPNLVPDLDVISLDHRGVGESDRLGCSIEEGAASKEGAVVTEEEWPACIEAIKAKWGSNLDTFTTTNAARDVGALIALEKRAGEKVFVWGGSYGSYLGQRYMQLFPEQPDGVVLEGIAAPPGLSFATYSGEMNDVGKQIFDLCAEDAVCKAHLGDDPWATTRAVVESFDAGHCPSLGVDANGFRSFLGSLLFYEDVRGAVAPVVHRARRCSAADVDAIVHLAGFFGGGGTSPRSSRSPRSPRSRSKSGLGLLDDSRALFYQISLTEFWDESGPSPADADAALRTYVTATGLTADVARRAQMWPKTPRDEHWAKIPKFDRPVLMLQGALDPATPAKYTEALRKELAGPHQTFVMFPAGAHDPSNGARLPDGKSCGLRIYADFLKDPSSTLDTSCVAQASPVTFASTDWEAKALFGTKDSWD